jgi:hypothetical protein
MNRREEKYLLKLSEENNDMLNYVIKVLNTYIVNHAREN